MKDIIFLYWLITQQSHSFKHLLRTTAGAGCCPVPCLHYSSALRHSPYSFGQTPHATRSTLIYAHWLGYREHTKRELSTTAGHGGPFWWNPGCRGTASPPWTRMKRISIPLRERTSLVKRQIGLSTFRRRTLRTYELNERVFEYGHRNLSKMQSHPHP
jgi:hypothetical protein